MVVVLATRLLVTGAGSQVVNQSHALHASCSLPTFTREPLDQPSSILVMSSPQLPHFQPIES